MTLPRSRGPVRRALSAWFAAPDEVSAHALVTATSHLEPGCDVVTDDDVQGALRTLYAVVRRDPAASVTGLDELPPLVRARVALESAFEFELRVRTAHHVAVACDGATSVAAAVLHLVDTMPGPDLPAYLERRATRAEVEEHRRLDDPEDGADADPLSDLPGHALARGNAATMFALHPRLRACALGFDAARAVVAARAQPRVAAGAVRVGLVPAPVSPAAAADSAADPAADLAAAPVDTAAATAAAAAADHRLATRALGEVAAGDAPDVAAEVLLGAASYLYLDAVLAAGLLAGWGEAERRDPVGA